MMSIITAILSALGKSFPFLVKVLGPILTLLGLGWMMRDPVADMLHQVAVIISVLVGSGICFYFVMKGISLLKKSK